nr:rna polymerase i-specific transcription initiation factor rrn3 [Quercus suber]
MPPPPTPITKRPTAGLKRDSSYLDTEDEEQSSQSTKKLRVAFSPTVDIRIMDDWDEKTLDLVRIEVETAIDLHLRTGSERDDTDYVKLLQSLNQDFPAANLQKKYLLALDSRISSLGECGKLVMAVLDWQWLGRDETFVALYIKFLCSAAVAHSKYIPCIMDKLVTNFIKLPATLGRLPDEAMVSRAKMFSRIHLAIKSILRQIPSASATLARTLKHEFPSEIATTRSYLQYQKHLLRLADYIPELKSDIMATITQRLVGIDMQIQLDFEDLDEEEEDKVLQKRPNPGDEVNTDDSDLESVSESEITNSEHEQRLRDLRLQVSKMDGTLDLLFEHYDPLIRNGLSPDINQSFQQLLSHFSKFIMPSRTRHAQFLLFHFSQNTSSHIMLFAKQCLDIATGGGSPSERLTACAYLASFVARGAHIPNGCVQEIFEVLCDYLEHMRAKYDPGCRGPDRRTYSLYYAVAQAILYIFCFRWRDLVIGCTTPEPGDADMSEDDMLAEGRELAWYPRIKEHLTKSIYSKLNPLKVCSPVIVSEFAKIANHLRFIYVFPLLETNKRIRLGHVSNYYSTGSMSDIGRRETAFDRKTGEAHLQLEAYFPFDPYHLPRSKRWVHSDYNEWKLPAGLATEDDEGDHSDSDDSDDSDEEEFDLDELDDMPLPDAVSISS